ncbi:MAG TPA: GGDEF domain-containing protein [Acidobacteriaceae bacterium]|nr:GGDEF domain-containing protein [Acidobacteriaceae bacterium]
MRSYLLAVSIACYLAAGSIYPQHSATVQSASPKGAQATPGTTSGVLTSVAQIRALPTNAAGEPVELHAVITYYQPTQGQIFIQDATGGIYVMPPVSPPDLHPGDAIVLRGVTVPSFSTNVRASEMKLDGSIRFPDPVLVSWRDILKRSNDCRYVSVTGVVRSATLQLASGQTPQAAIHQRAGASPQTTELPQDAYLLIDLLMDGGSVRVHMQDVAGIDPLKLLDSEVKMTGVAGGLFDGKFQQIGAELWVSAAKHMQVLKPALDNPANLPPSDIARLESQSWVRDESQRLRVRGSVTLYQPGLQLVVETPDRQSVLVNTYEQSPLRVGQIVDVVGFPVPHEYSLEYSEAIGQANVLPTPESRVIQPLAIQWDDAMAGHNPYDLISMEGTLADEVRERHQDTLVIKVGPHVFSAILPRTVWNQDFDQFSLPEYRIGSKIRVTGVCFAHAGGPWNTERWFDVEMRTPEDVMVLADPSWWTVRHLLYLSGALVALMLTALVWAMLLQKQVRIQSEQIRVTMESEAARERRIAQMEKERGRVLEAINSKQNLEEVLQMIVRLISQQLGDRACWCELPNGTRVGDAVPDDGAALLVRRDIYSSVGERLGSLVLAGADVYSSRAGEVMEMGGSLAALAIDNRRLYETLVHRSQYDQLTNAANRFLLENRLDEVISLASRNSTRFALVYIDLDQFKRVNDLYGHRVGDLYLQQVAQRFADKLRGMDTLARVGGDEFIALIPTARSRAEVEEIGQRLLRSFERPFLIEGHVVQGSASIGIAIYPEDGLTKEELKRVADAAMYAHKPTVAD